VLTRRHDGALLALFSDRWRLGQVQRDFPDLLLELLIAGEG
jgi:peptide chain release factor 3